MGLKGNGRDLEKTERLAAKAARGTLRRLLPGTMPSDGYRSSRGMTGPIEPTAWEFRDQTHCKVAM